MKSLISLSQARTLVFGLGMSSLLGSSLPLIYAAEPVKNPIVVTAKSDASGDSANRAESKSWLTSVITPVQYSSKTQVKSKNPTTSSAQAQEESTIDGVSRWVKRHLPGGGEDEKSTKVKEDKERQPRERGSRGSDAPLTNSVPAQNVSSSTNINPNQGSVMKELEKLYEQNGVPAPEFHPMLEAKAQPALPTSRKGKVSRRDSKFLAKLGVPPGTPLNTAQPQTQAIAPAPVVSAPVQQPVMPVYPPAYQQPMMQPSSPITVQINLQPTPVGNAVAPQSIQYQMPTNGQLSPVTIPVPMQQPANQQYASQQPSESTGKGRSGTNSMGADNEFFPNDQRKVHNSEDDGFFFDEDGDADEKLDIASTTKPTPSNKQSSNQAAGKFPSFEEVPNQQMQSSDPAFSAQPAEDNKPILNDGENPFGFPTAGIKEANKKLSEDGWINDMKKSPNSEIEAKTVSSTKAQPNLITSKDFEKTKLETPADRRLRLIRERQGQSGLKGFCPVVLRDQRELLDSNLEFRVQHDGKTYHVSTAEAQAKFLADPERYAPANQSNDIVQQQKTGARVEGSLDHALWFGGKLYLFTSAENQSAFAQQPKKYLN